MDRLVSIIIPTYNERDNIEPLVKRINSALSDINFEIIIIDDDSRDGTAEIAENLSTGFPVRVIVRKDERGLASAVVEGFKQATGEILGVMDADLQHPPEVLPNLIQAIEDNADIAIASRYVPGGAIPNWGLVRRFISKGAIFLAHLALTSTGKINDPMSGYFMLKKEVLGGANLMPTGYKILLEILIEGKYRKVTEVPFTFGNRFSSESKMRLRQQIDYLKHLYSLMRRKGEIIRFLKFCAVGASGVVVNLGLYWLLTRFVWHTNSLSAESTSMNTLAEAINMNLAAAISIETSIISNFILNDFFTFPDRRSNRSGTFLKRLLKFNLISLAGLGLNLGVFNLSFKVFKVYDLLSMLIGISVATLWNYLINRSWTWKE